MLTAKDPYKRAKKVVPTTGRYADGGAVDDPDARLQSLGYRQDNPAVSRGNTEWLASKQRGAYRDPKLLSGAITGYFGDVVNIPVSMLAGVPGAMDENPVPGTYKYDQLMKDVKKRGWKPSPILVGVNHQGKPYILEGNHRAAVARAIGQTHVPGDIRWWNGGEETEGPWHPRNIAPHLKSVERSKRAFGGSVRDRFHRAVEYARGGRAEIDDKLLGMLKRPGSGYVPPKNKPGTVKIPGMGEVEARPIEAIEQSAQKYTKQHGRHHDNEFSPFNEDFARKVAEAFERMEHNPNDPKVKRAYDALIDETLAQYHAARDTGIDFKFIRPGEADPYAASPSLGYADIVNKGKLHVFPTEAGFGSSDRDVRDNPLLKKVGRIGDLNDATVNDAFRIVHDLYGHYGPGNPFFRAPGEERAFVKHAPMYGPEARKAAATETRGQNSWVNYGPFGDRNRKASGADTVFADQKTGLLPDELTGPVPKADGGSIGVVPDEHPVVADAKQILAKVPSQVKAAKQPVDPMSAVHAIATTPQDQAMQVMADNAERGLKMPLDAAANRLRMKLARHKKAATKGEDLPGMPSNPRMVVRAPEGRPDFVVGRITPDDWVRRHEQILSPDEIKDSASWYSKIYDNFLRQTKGDEAQAKKYMRGWLVAQQNVDVSGAMNNVLLQSEQMKRGMPEAAMRAAGMPNPTAAARSVLMDRPITGVGQKISDFVDAAEGKRVRSWMANHPDGGQPFVVDVHTGRDTGLVDQELINHLTRLGYNAKDIKKLKVDMHASPSETQYENRVQFGHELTDHLNRIGWQGRTDWTPAEVQAVGWMGMTKLTANQADDVVSGLDRNTRRLSMELAPGEGSPWHHKYGDAFAKLSPADQYELTHHMTQKAIAHASKLAGIDVRDIVHGTGGWQQYQNPSTVGQALATKEGAEIAANVLGHALQQTEVWSNSVKPVTSSPKGFAVDFIADGNHNLHTDEGLRDFWEKIMDADPLKGTSKALFQGYQPIRDIDGRVGIRALIDRGGLGTMKTLNDAVEGPIRTLVESLPFDVSAKMHEAEIIKARNDWTEHKDGQAYKSRLVDLLKRDPSTDLGRIGQELEEEFAKKLAEKGQVGFGSRPLGRARGGKVAPKHTISPEQLARAKALGYDTDKVWYHSSLEPLDEFKAHGQFMGRSGTAGIHLTDSYEAANRYLDRFGDYRYDGKPFQKNVIPVFVKKGRVLERDEPFKSPVGMGMPVPAGYENPVTKMGYDALLRNENISARGSTVAHGDYGGRSGLPHKELVLYDPTRVRSIYAQFDPESVDSAQLSKARGGAVNHTPTDAQKSAGNYAKRRMSFQGIPITIENELGSTRSGRDDRGRAWSCKLPADYGYIRGTEGSDGDHVDCYVGPAPDSNLVVLVNQRHLNGDMGFDEHKAILGAPSEKAALKIYCDGFSDGRGPDRVMSVEVMSIDAFKNWLRKGNTQRPARAKSIVDRALALTARP